MNTSIRIVRIRHSVLHPSPTEIYFAYTDGIHGNNECITGTAYRDWTGLPSLRPERLEGYIQYPWTP